MLDKIDHCKYTMLVGRVLIAWIYFYGGLNWLISLSPPVGALEASGWPLPVLAAWIGLILKLGGSALLIVGYQTRIAALALTVFTIGTAFGFHFPDGIASFWTDATFMKELAMIGGLLMVAAAGPGALSLDAKCAAKKSAPAM